MKFKSRFGLGEIVVTKHHSRQDGRTFVDQIGKVVEISFPLGAQPLYRCRMSGSDFVANFLEAELVGDDDYDQELGGYPLDVTIE